MCAYVCVCRGPMCLPVSVCVHEQYCDVSTVLQEEGQARTALRHNDTQRSANSSTSTENVRLFPSLAANWNRLCICSSAPYMWVCPF